MARKGTLRRRRKSLEEREQRERRDLGELVLQMFREGRLDQDLLANQAAVLAGTESELDQVRRDLGELPPERADIEEGSLAAPPADTAEGAVPGPPETAEASRPADTVAPESGGAPGPAESGGAAGPGPGADEDDALSQLTREIERTEASAQGADAARREAEDRATAEILALEQDLERERRRAAEALDSLRARLADAEERAARPEQERAAGESEARSAAASWLRGQAEAMRREAERQVREELEEGELSRLRDQARSEARTELEERIADLEQAKRNSDRALAEMTQRSNEANSRAERERESRETALAEAEARLAEIEGYVKQVEAQLESRTAEQGPAAEGSES